MTAILQSLRTDSTYSGTGDVDSAWRGAGAAATVVTHRSAQVRVQLATGDGVASGSQPGDDYPCEDLARRNFTRRELAADLQRLGAGQAATTSSEPQEENDRTEAARDPE